MRIDRACVLAVVTASLFFASFAGLCVRKALASDVIGRTVENVLKDNGVDATTAKEVGNIASAIEDLAKVQGPRGTGPWLNLIANADELTCSFVLQILQESEEELAFRITKRDLTKEEAAAHRAIWKMKAVFDRACGDKPKTAAGGGRKETQVPGGGAGQEEEDPKPPQLPVADRICLKRCAKERRAYNDANNDYLKTLIRAKPARKAAKEKKAETQRKINGARKTEAQLKAQVAKLKAAYKEGRTKRPGAFVRSDIRDSEANLKGVQINLAKYEKEIAAAEKAIADANKEISEKYEKVKPAYDAYVKCLSKCIKQAKNAKDEITIGIPAPPRPPSGVVSVGLADPVTTRSEEPHYIAVREPGVCHSKIYTFAGTNIEEYTQTPVSELISFSEEGEPGDVQSPSGDPSDTPGPQIAMTPKDGGDPSDVPGPSHTPDLCEKIRKQKSADDPEDLVEEVSEGKDDGAVEEEVVEQDGPPDEPKDRPDYGEAAKVTTTVTIAMLDVGTGRQITGAQIRIVESEPELPDPGSTPNPSLVSLANYQDGSTAGITNTSGQAALEYSCANATQDGQTAGTLKDKGTSADAKSGQKSAPGGEDGKGKKQGKDAKIDSALDYLEEAEKRTDAGAPPGEGVYPVRIKSVETERVYYMARRDTSKGAGIEGMKFDAFANYYAHNFALGLLVTFVLDVPKGMAEEFIKFAQDSPGVVHVKRDDCGTKFQRNDFGQYRKRAR